jgi:RNA polymerase sigma-70 factor (ECF subfamily)
LAFHREMSKPIPPRHTNVVDEREDARQLLERVAVGDRSAFQSFYERFAARVMAKIRRSVGQVAVAEELVQEVFVAAWLNAPQYRRHLGEPESWLFGITRHKLVDHARRMRGLATAVEAPLGPDAPDTREPDVERQIRMQRALAVLTVDQRRVIDLIYQTGLTFTETARVLNVPTGTVKSRVHIALTTMRGVLKDSMP